MFALVAVVLTARPPVARADDNDSATGAGDTAAATATPADQAAAVAQIAELNRKALEAYDNLNFDEAKTALKNALALCDRNGLGTDPVRAQSYLNLGVVLLASDAQHRDVAVANLRRAIQIRPDIKLPERLARPGGTAGFRRGADVGARHHRSGSDRRRDRRAASGRGPRWQRQR